VNTKRRDRQTDPSVATLEDGHNVFVYYSNFEGGTQGKVRDIMGRVLDSEGREVIAEFTVNPLTAGTQFNPEVVGLAGGRFAVIWSSSRDLDGNSVKYDAIAQIFEIDTSGAGSKLVRSSPIMPIANDPDMAEQAPTIVDTAGGGFFATWTVKNGNVVSVFYEYDFMGQFYNADGSTNGDAFGVARVRTS
jgi:hypothetical protein